MRDSARCRHDPARLFGVRVFVDLPGGLRDPFEGPGWRTALLVALRARRRFGVGLRDLTALFGVGGSIRRAVRRGSCRSSYAFACTKVGSRHRFGGVVARS